MAERACVSNDQIEGLIITILDLKHDVEDNKRILSVRCEALIEQIRELSTSCKNPRQNSSDHYDERSRQINDINLKLFSPQDERDTKEHDPKDDAVNDKEKHITFRSYLQRFAESSSLHGLPNITAPGQALMKVFWIFMLMTALVFLVWQIWILFSEYNKYPVYVDVQVHHDNLTFPQITACMKDPYKRSKLTQHPLIGNRSYLRLNVTPRNQHYFELREAINSLPDEELTKLGYDAPDFIRVAYYIGSKHHVANATLLFNPFHGNCYTFKPPNDVNDIMLTINVNAKERILYQSPASAELHLHHIDTDPFSSTTQLVNVEPGKETSAALRMEEINLLNGKYGYCNDDEEMFKRRTGYMYTKNLCEEECKIKTIINLCQCFKNFLFKRFPRDFKMPELAHAHKCLLTGEEEECIYELYYHSPTVKPYCQCKPKCNTNTYTVKTKASKLVKNIGTFRSKYLGFNSYSSNDTIIEQWVISNYAKVKLKFQETRFKEFTQRPLYPLSRFMSDLGGTMGLYLGASILTLCELIQVLYGILMYLLK